MNTQKKKNKNKIIIIIVMENFAVGLNRQLLLTFRTEFGIFEKNLNVLGTTWEVEMSRYVLALSTCSVHRKNGRTRF